MVVIFTAEDLTNSTYTLTISKEQIKLQDQAGTERPLEAITSLNVDSRGLVAALLGILNHQKETFLEDLKTILKENTSYVFDWEGKVL